MLDYDGADFFLSIQQPYNKWISWSTTIGPNFYNHVVIFINLVTIHFAWLVHIVTAYFKS